jgi:dihydropteroate synthase
MEQQAGQLVQTVAVFRVHDVAKSRDAIGVAGAIVANQ